MGAPNHELIPAAVLLEHPRGLTAEEFVTALDATRFSWRSCDVFADWDDYGPGTRTDDTYGTRLNEAGDFHRGIFGLAEILGLKRTAYRTNMERLMRETEFEQELESFEVTAHKDGETWTEPHYRFTLHTHDEIGGRHIIENVGQGMEPGRLIRQWVSGRRCVIDRVLSQELLAKTEDIACDFDAGPIYRSALEVRPVQPCYTREVFPSLASMLAAHPDVDPLKMYDFTQEHGIAGGLLANAPWRRRDSKYFLDTESIWRESREELYTSIHITADAIRRGAWNLFGYDGMRHLQRYFADMPVARQAHDRVVLHWWAAKHAEKAGMTNTDFLRFLQEIRMRPPPDPQHEAVYVASCVENEGCGWGRYLLSDLKERRAFSEDERAALAQALKEGKGATPWLREYLQRIAASLPPEPVHRRDEDVVPF